jgi:hypothetical protein
VLSVFVGILMFAVMSPMYSVMDYIWGGTHIERNQI